MYYDSTDSDNQTNTSCTSSTDAECAKINSQIYSSEIYPALWKTQIPIFLFNNETDNILNNNPENLIYPIFTSIKAKDISLFSRQYIVKEPIIDVKLDNYILENCSGQNFSLKYNYKPKSKCYTISRYITPVDTIRPQLSPNGDMYGKANIDFTDTTCYYTSNIVVIRADCAKNSLIDNFTYTCEENVVSTSYSDDNCPVAPTDTLNSCDKNNFIKTIDQIQAEFCNNKIYYENILSLCNESSDEDSDEDESQKKKKNL